MKEFMDEYQPLLGTNDEDDFNDDDKFNGKNSNNNNKGLSVLFATLCLIDLFGVFPVVTMPRSIIDCGWLGIPLVFGVFILQVYTAILLGRCWIMAERIDPTIKLQSRRPYAALAELTYGPLPGYLVTILLDLTVFAGGVPNLLVASQNMQLLGEKAAILNWDVSYCYWMPLIGVSLCPFMWLGSPKDMKWIVVSSSCMVILVSLLTWTLIIGGNNSAVPPPIPKPSWEAIAIAYGILAFQFDVHPMILTVQVDMANKMKLGQAIFSAFSVTGGLFLLTSVLGAVWFGSDLEYNLLRSLPSSELLDINVLLVTLQICLSTVVGCTALFQDLEDKLGVKKEFSLARCLLRTSLVLLSIFLSEIVPRFDLIMGLVGGSMMGPLMFVLPPLFYARLRAMEPQPEFESILTETAPFANSQKKKYYYISHSTKQKYEKKFKKIYNYTYEKLPNDDDDEDDKYNQLVIYKSSSTSLSYFSIILKKIKHNFLNLISLDNYPKIGPMVLWERIKTIVIVGAGLLATVLSTYYSLREAINYARFTPPCFFNVTAATLAVD